MRLARATLHVLATLKEAGANEETLEVAGLLASGLGGRLLHYQDVLAQHGIGLPYGDPLTVDEVPMEDCSSQNSFASRRLLHRPAIAVRIAEEDK